MLQLAFVVAFFAAVSAEQVPCGSGQAACAGFAVNSVQNGNVFCCNDGFDIKWTSGSQQPTCMCERVYTERDCITGYENCAQVGSFSMINGKYQCCSNGESMTSVSQSFVNGVPVDYCKCRKSLNGNRLMTPEQKARLDATLQSIGQSVNTNLNQVFTGLDNVFGPGGNLFGRRGLVSNWRNAANRGVNGKK
ncbi:uncharacterized protein LOC101855102 [Aplysia californica]|uniref:Uncharacterized protein LOC101855102 n=1 Tax=Aplysia californica TaxID=6500 RepID=A0ABM0JQH4_APLCA|nr:uncharacterized protein LOC101855102 [Aplysia californica]XP_005099168.1 uncharacterized protein LOC101855102 [Aplysia californica]